MLFRSCHPSYATIGSAIGMSNNTVRKYVESLERKGFIYTEPTMVRTRDGRSHNGSLQYTLQPIKPLEEAYFEKQLREAEARARFNQAMKKFEKKGGNLDEAVNVYEPRLDAYVSHRDGCGKSPRHLPCKCL